MIDDGVGVDNLPQGLALMTFLSSGLLARGFAQTRHARRLLQTVARRRLAAVRTVQSEPALKFGDTRSQCRDLSRLRLKQRNELFLRWFDRHVAIHQILESERASVVQKNRRALKSKPVKVSSAPPGQLRIREAYRQYQLRLTQADVMMVPR
jgi:hypothetical protein